MFSGMKAPKALNEKLNSTYMLNLVLLSSSLSFIIFSTFYPQ